MILPEMILKLMQESNGAFIEPLKAALYVIVNLNVFLVLKYLLLQLTCFIT